MENQLDKLAHSKRFAAKTLFATFKILKELNAQ